MNFKLPESILFPEDNPKLHHVIQANSPNKVVILKSGNILEISKDGILPPPEDLCALLEPKLRYTKIIHLFGADRWDELTGEKRTKKFEPRLLYTRDSAKRLICSFGFIHKILKICKKANYNVYIGNADPPLCRRPRPDCYKPNWDRVFSKFQFYPRQEECLKQIAENPCGIVHAVTGFGKMVIMAMVSCLYPKAKIDIVTKRSDVVNKIRACLLRWLPDVGQVGAGLKIKDRVTVYTTASLHLSNFDADILLCDEGHEVISDNASGFLAKYRYSRNYSLTASPQGRSDGSDIRMESLFGTRIFYISYKEAVELGLVVPIRVEWTTVKSCQNYFASLEGVRRERASIWANRDRNLAIANKARSFGEAEQVQILVRTIEHAVRLKEFLPEFTLVYDKMDPVDRNKYIKSGLLKASEPDMTPELREKLRCRFEAGDLKKVISTNVWAVGIDPRQLTALIRADAVSSEIMDIQAPGRVSRTHSASNKSVGIVCDFMDSFDPYFLNKSRRRYKHYQKMGWEQIIDDGKKVPEDTDFDDSVLQNTNQEQTGIDTGSCNSRAAVDVEDSATDAEYEQENELTDF